MDCWLSSFFKIFHPPEGLPLANLAVILFFVLSSFLLTYLATHEYLRNRKINIAKFLMRRVLRIWPLYFFIIGVVYITIVPWSPFSKFMSYAPASVSWVNNKFWIFLSFLSNWYFAFAPLQVVHIDPNYAPAELMVLWSIAVEEQLYLIYPFFISILFYRPQFKYWLLAIVLALSIISRYLFFISPHSHHGGMYYSTFSYLDVFLAGGVAGSIAARFDLPKVVPTLFRYSFINLILTGILLLLAWWWRKGMWYPYSWLSIYIYGLFGIVIAAKILWVITNPNAMISCILRSNLLRTLGKLSFGMYLWHFIALRIVEQTVAITLNNLSFSISKNLLFYLIFILYIFCTILLATVSYVLVEKPFLRLKDVLNNRSTVIPVIDLGPNLIPSKQ